MVRSQVPHILYPYGPLMMNIIHKVCALLLYLMAASFQANADELPHHLKDASQLTQSIYEKAKPSVLLCVLPFSPESDMSGDIIGKVIPGTKPGTFICEYTRFLHGVANGSDVSTDFKWLGTTYDQLASWLTSLAHIEKNDKGHYYVLRNPEHTPEHPPAICAQSTLEKGFEFGYETVSDDGQKSCGHFVGAVYSSPYFVFEDIVPGGCSSKSFSPDCESCNGGGCGCFGCSSWTYWPPCPAGSHTCEMETCCGGFCPRKRHCDWDK